MKKKIVFFVESMHCGGAERSLLSLLSNLDSQKYDIDLLVINKGGEFEKFIPTWINYKSVNPIFGFFGRIKFKILCRLDSKVHKAQLFWRSFGNKIEVYPYEYDIAVAWGQGFATYYTACKIKASKKFAWVNIDYEKAGYQFQYDKNIYCEFDKVVGVSDFVKKSMQKYFEKSKVIFIKNIIDEADILERANKSKSKEFLKDNLTIVSIGRLATQKRFDLSIFTAKVLNENNIDFEWYIVGEGNERQHLESLIQDNHLSNKVFLLGFRDNPYPYIKDCDIYVQTSAFEGLGRTLIEASILCKPIVTTNFPTAYGLVENGKTGFVVEMFPEKIAKKIELLHLDKALYSEMVRELSKKSNNDKQIIIEKVFELFES